MNSAKRIIAALAFAGAAATALMPATAFAADPEPSGVVADGSLPPLPLDFKMIPAPVGPILTGIVGAK